MGNKKDSQSNKYQLTINNPASFGYTHEKIFEIFRDNFKTLEYLCMSDEQGGQYHTHIFACFTSRVRFSMIKKHFAESHIEVVKGSVTDNITYIKKTGKWENDTKHGTKIEGTYEEWGTQPPDSKGKNRNMQELYRMIADGYSNADILAENQDYILQIDKLDKLRTILLTEKYKGKRRLDLKVIYRYGITGAGKTRGILDEFGDENVYRVTDYQHPFDGYNCQPIMVFEEFRSALRIKDMLNYCDIYPLELPARYSNKYACYNVVYIVSNWSLESQYSELQRDDAESWNAFLRRIHKVEVYTKDGVSTYDTVAEYFKRNIEFKPVTKEEQLTIPFK